MVKRQALHGGTPKARLCRSKWSKAADKLEDETVRKIMGFARDLSAPAGAGFAGTR